jgi:hypothetical protein
LLVAFAIAVSGCSQEPVMCLHIDATPGHDAELRAMVVRVGEQVGARVRDFSDDKPTEGNVADVFVKLEGVGADAVLAHQSMHPWVCLYGTPGSAEVVRLQELFEQELRATDFPYSIEERQSKLK